MNSVDKEKKLLVLSSIIWIVNIICMIGCLVAKDYAEYIDAWYFGTFYLLSPILIVSVLCTSALQLGAIINRYS